MKQGHFLAYGLNHETAPVEVREKYAAPPEEARRALETLKSTASEALFLSTCNRVEFYLVAESPEPSLDAVRKWFRERHALKDEVADRVFYRRNGPEAFRHLFRVASSLDSMVVGEAQILGQVKSAYQDAVKAGTIGPFLNAVFQRAFAAAKHVRSRTGIARWPVSVSSVAVDLALKIFGRLDELTVLILGAGEMSENTARHLVTSGVKRFFVANRTLHKARVLARRLKGRPLTLLKGRKILREADIVISSIGGQRPFLKAGTVRDAMRDRRGKPLFLIDIGVPRNIESETGRIKSVYLFNIDDLSRAAQANLGERAKAVAQAEVILEEDLQALRTWLKHRFLVPAIQDLREQVETIRLREWDDYLRNNPGLDGKTLAHMERREKSLSAKFLHVSTLALKERGGGIPLVGYAEAVRGLFVVGPKTKNGSAP